ncbi:MAG: bifunctional precorrin-2 dehydrogenase/sirohydrochlorin ferrochelatase [Syntrophales bacterium]|jgi:precorrin-2 dehydrogenase/sirohydrochlorin ferrochelatase|nr:bifunctional precorrin-2 dehydrogenase/sirohydrochlorin ferrochelatase [Syntrophales bacterium]MDY0044874.1 bifunctional precorrin-2 dehydrogenase/sirohydrochlorin ferrochelatase [Syntrophales bacterium]
MSYYPIFLNLANRRCLVVGGGEVACRKAARLVRCGSKVVVVSRFLVPELEQMKKKGDIDHIDDDYRSEYIKDAVFLIGATDVVEVNSKIYEDGEKRGLLVNIVDNPSLCNCILPSSFQQGELTVAVSTGGKSPALAKRIRQEIEKNYGSEYAGLIEIMGILRQKVSARKMSSSKNRLLYESVLDSGLLELIRKKDVDAIIEKIVELTGEKMDRSQIQDILSHEMLPDYAGE